MSRPFLTPVPDVDLPEYPIGSDVRLNNWFLRWEPGRWRGSEMYLTADPEVGYAYLNMIFAAQDQVPIGTLPADRRLIARLLHMTDLAFEALCRRDPSPMRHWVECVSDRGEVRLMHPVVRDTLLEQMTQREARALAAGADAERKRLGRLAAVMKEACFDKAAIADEVLLRRLDDWLNQNVKGNRTREAYDRAFLHAARAKWFAQGGVTH